MLLARGRAILSARPRVTQLAGLLLALIVLSIQFGRMIAAPIDEVDEAAVYDSTAYLELWRQGQLFDPAWQGVDAIDHPPLWKYAHGAALVMAGQPLESLAEKERWFDWAWDGDDDGAFKRHLNARLGPQIRPGRWLSFLAVAAALVLLSGLIARAYSPAVSGPPRTASSTSRSTAISCSATRSRRLARSSTRGSTRRVRSPRSQPSARRTPRTASR